VNWWWLRQTAIIHQDVSYACYVNENRIHFLPELARKQARACFSSDIPFNQNNLLGAVFGLLGNEENAVRASPNFPALLDVLYINGESFAWRRSGLKCLKQY
jgi:hypothetical protein